MPARHFGWTARKIFLRKSCAEIPCDKVCEDEYALAPNDIAPQAPVHILVIPKGPYVSIDDFGARAGYSHTSI